MRVLNPLRVQMHLDGGGSATLYYDRKKLAPTEVVLPRIAQSISTYGLAVVNQFALGGVPLVNHAQAIAQSRSKMRSLQLLSAHGIAIPATVMARDAAHLKEMVGLVGGVPVLVKLLQGQEKHGVMVCESLQSLEAALEAVLGLGHNLVMQEYVKSTSQDVRVLVVGERRWPRSGAGRDPGGLLTRSSREHGWKRWSCRPVRGPRRRRPRGWWGWRWRRWTCWTWRGTRRFSR